MSFLRPLYEQNSLLSCRRGGGETNQINSLKVLIKSILVFRCKPYMQVGYPNKGMEATFGETYMCEISKTSLGDLRLSTSTKKSLPGIMP